MSAPPTASCGNRIFLPSQACTHATRHIHAHSGFFNKGQLLPLTKEAITKYLSNGTHTKGDLLEAYKAAEDPSTWSKKADEGVRRAEEAASRMAEDEDELADEGGEDEEDGQPTKKRKSNAGGKVREAKKPGAATAGKKKAAAGGAEKKAETGKKRKADGSAKESAKDEDDDKEPDLDPASKRVKGWRHDLQRNLLGKDGVLKEVSRISCADILPYFDVWAGPLTRLVSHLPSSEFTRRPLCRSWTSRRKCSTRWRSTRR